MPVFKMKTPLFNIQQLRRFSSFRGLNQEIKISPLAKIRNIGIIAHIDAGKTTTTERMLYYGGLTRSIGNVDDGDTVTDYLSAERERGITIQSASVTLPWNGRSINLIDTPGHADFTFEVIRSLRVLDGVVTILDSVAGVEAQTEKVWKQASDLGIPKLAFLNKMDRDGAGFGRTVKEIVARLGTRVVLVNVPHFKHDSASQGSKFDGVIDVFEKKLLQWEEGDGTDLKVTDISDHSTTPELYEECERCLEAAVETLGEFDEEVVSAFLETEDYMKVPPSVLKAALKRATLESYAVPVLCGSSFKNIGVQPLLDAVVDYLPSPLEMKLPEVTTDFKSIARSKKKQPKKDEVNDNHLAVTIDPVSGLNINNNKNLTTALAFKVLTDPMRGIMVFVRVYSGQLQPNSTLLNTTTGERIKIKKLLLMHADTPREVSKLESGSIGVITGVNSIRTGDTLVSHATKKDVNGLQPRETMVKLHPINIPPPVFSVSLEPVTHGDRRNMETALETVLREDPSLHLSEDDESGQTILSGMGELHLEITKDRLLKDMKVNVDVGDVKVTFKETILRPTNYFTKTVPCEKGGEFKITLSLDSFEGDIKETSFAEEPSFIALNMDNNAILLEESSESEKIRESLKGLEGGEKGWPFAIAYETMIRALVSGVTASLQVGGPIARLPVHSTIVRIKEWEVPLAADNVSPLLTLARQAVLEALASLDPKDTTLMEPQMKVSVYVNDEDLGVVIQDLMGTRKANISGIEETGDEAAGDELRWAKQEAERTYVPQDPTMMYIKSGQAAGKKAVRFNSPLKEMIGYLPKLRSLTKGRGVYDMEFAGMYRIPGDRLQDVLRHDL